MNTVIIEGIKLSYAEKNNTGTKTIFFFHGNSSDHHTWREQLNSPSLDNYRLIAFDLPAHGSSDASDTATDDYSLPGIARLMAKATIQLAEGNPYLLAGFSLGTNIIAEMFSFQVAPVGIVLVSSCVISTMADFQNAFFPNPYSGLLFQDEADIQELKHLAEDSFFIHAAADLEWYIAAYTATKLPFRSSLIKSSMEGNLIDEIASLQNTGLPLLIVFGLNEKIVNPDYMGQLDLHLWRDQIFKLDEARHFVHMDQARTFNQLLAEYAADRFTPGHS